MAVLDALGQYLQTQGVGTLGTNIFLTILPDNPDVCLVVTEENGTGPVHHLGNNMDALNRPRIRVFARAGRNDYPAARALAQSARVALRGIANQTVEGVYILSITPTSDFYPITRDGDDRPVIGCDYSGWLA